MAVLLSACHARNGTMLLYLRRCSHSKMINGIVFLVQFKYKYLLRRLNVAMLCHESVQYIFMANHYGLAIMAWSQGYFSYHNIEDIIKGHSNKEKML